MSKTTTSTDGRTLSVTRLMNASPAEVYAAWTTPHLLEQFFAPAPFVTRVTELDVRPGGVNAIVMQGPDGTDFQREVCIWKWLKMRNSFSRTLTRARGFRPKGHS